MYLLNNAFGLLECRFFRSAQINCLYHDCYGLVCFSVGKNGGSDRALFFNASTKTNKKNKMNR